jgi:preprotein translocase subunit SecG
VKGGAFASLGVGIKRAFAGFSGREAALKRVTYAMTWVMSASAFLVSIGWGLSQGGVIVRV